MSAGSLPVQDGLVIANYGRTLLVETQNGHRLPCVARRSAAGAVCGDRVQWQASGDGGGVVLAVQPRSAVLARPDGRGAQRPVCANLDQIAVVGAVRHETGHLPASERARIDAYLAAAEMLRIDALLIVNKIDLLPAPARPALEQAVAPYRAAGYAVICTSTLTRAGMAELGERFRDRRSVLVGESGVGKSSLTQVLLPDLDIRIGELSPGDGKGRHTTTVTLLFHLPGGGDLIDSPGVREFRLGKVEPAALADAFREFRPYLGACRYRDCRHLNEPGCALALAADEGRLSRERLAGYREILLGGRTEGTSGGRRTVR